MALVNKKIVAEPVPNDSARFLIDLLFRSSEVHHLIDAAIPMVVASANTVRSDREITACSLIGPFRGIRDIENAVDVHELSECRIIIHV